MLLIQKPKKGCDYLKVNNNKLNIKLQMAGFIPKYKWGKIYYYVVTKDLKDYIKMGVSKNGKGL